MVVIVNITVLDMHVTTVTDILDSSGLPQESLDLGSDYDPSFIYADIFDERTQHEDELVFRTPSISPDFVNTQ